MMIFYKLFDNCALASQRRAEDTVRYGDSDRDSPIGPRAVVSYDRTHTDADQYSEEL